MFKWITSRFSSNPSLRDGNQSEVGGKKDTSATNAQLPTVFISHSTQDRAFVEREIIPLLHDQKIQTWYSPQSIQTADEWERSIRKGLEGCGWFLVVMSPHAAKSEWVRAEVFWAINKRRGRIVPVFHETCDPTDFHLMLFQIQGVDFRRDPKEAKRKLIAVFPARTTDLASSQASPVPSPEAMPPASEDASPLFSLGMVYYQQGDHDRAIAEFTSALELCPDYPAAYIMRGVAYNSKSEHEKAIADFTSAINLKPNKALAALAYAKRGNSRARREEYQQGIADCTTAIHLDATNAGAYLDRGAIYHLNLQNEKALADFNHAIQLDPKFTQAYINRAGIYRILGQADQAKVDYAQAVKLDPAVAKKIPEHFKGGDEKLQSRIEDALLSVHALGPITRLDKLTPQGKMQALSTLAAIGWPKILSDLEFLQKNLPNDHPHRPGLVALLDIVRKVAPK